MNKEDFLKDRILNEMVCYKIPLSVEQIERIQYAVSHLTLFENMKEESKNIFLGIYEYLEKQLDIAKSWEKERKTKAGIIKEKLLTSKREDLATFVLITESDSNLKLENK